MIINIAETFVGIAKEYGERTAIIDARTGDKISFAELNRRADMFANYFASEGLSPGDVAILMVTPSIDFICLTLALFKVGTPIVLIDPGMGYKNLLRCIERVKPKFLIGITKAILFSKLFQKPFQTVEKVFCCGNSFGLFGPDITKNIAESEADLPSLSTLRYRSRRDYIHHRVYGASQGGPIRAFDFQCTIASDKRVLCHRPG